MGILPLVISWSLKGFGFSLLTLIFNLDNPGNHQRSFLEVRWIKGEYFLISFLWNFNRQWNFQKEESK